MTSVADATSLVRWRSIAEPSTDGCTLRPAPEENRGFVESSGYLFAKPPGPGWSFRLDDEPLQDAPDNASCWLWKPGFFAGEVTAELMGPDGTSHALFLLDVAPDTRKVGRDMFARMISELWAEDPALVIGSEPGTLRMGELGSMQDPWVAFARLRRYAPEFLRALVPIRTHPRRTLRVRRDSAQLHHVRRVDRHTAVSVARSPAAALLRPQVDQAPFTTDARLDVPVVEETLDSSANRAMLALALALLQRTRLLGERLQQLVDSDREIETRTPLAARWPVRRQFLDTLARQIRSALRQPPFPQVRRAEISAAGLTAIAADPLYSRGWGRGWRALRHGVESDLTSERLWVSPSWEIYERWCFLRLGQLLASTMPTWGWRRRISPDRWIGALADRSGELRLQPTFRTRALPAEGPWSVSRERVPDMVLSVVRSNSVRFIVLDAKYRSSRSNVLDAMASAHIYQDSLRIGPQRPDQSLLIVPSGGGATWLEDPEFQDQHRVGVHVLSPDGDATLPSVMTRTLEL